MEPEDDEVGEPDVVMEALALLIEQGRVTVTINEDGERVFRLTEARE